MPATAPELRAKEDALQARLRAAGRVLVAFSGGVDSSYLALAAHRALGAGALAVTAVSPSYPESHRRVAEDVVQRFGIAHRFVDTHEMERAGYRANGPDRCYHCKSELFEVLGQLRDELGFDAVAYGVNTDDTGDFRPGHRAADEHGVLSPFLDVALSKAEIRALSRAAGPADRGSARLRLPRLAPPLRDGGDDRAARAGGAGRGAPARARLPPAPRAPSRRRRARRDRARRSSRARSTPRRRARSSAALKPLGFRYVALDLEGYRTGALNEVLPGAGRT